MFINPNFGRKNIEVDDSRLPPGQYLTEDFPVLSIGPTPEIDISEWTLKVWSEDFAETYSYKDLLSLESTDLTKDIHCVTKWSKFDTNWKGVWFETLIKDVEDFDLYSHVLFHSADGYTTNLPIEDILEDKCLIAYEYDGEDIDPPHGGPVRGVIPHLYFWKSSKWLNGIELLTEERQGFWEERGYHNYGDPWKEQRYSD
jgi:DMSO/TMAO reductase YedYZ molybdopterin-dependent catalytic subunit